MINGDRIDTAHQNFVNYQTIRYPIPGDRNRKIKVVSEQKWNDELSVVSAAEILQCFWLYKKRVLGNAVHKNLNLRHEYKVTG